MPPWNFRLDTHPESLLEDASERAPDPARRTERMTRARGTFRHPDRGRSRNVEGMVSRPGAGTHHPTTGGLPRMEPRILVFRGIPDRAL